MSEKLYNVIEAVDIFDENSPIPERYLVFMDGDGNQIKEFFPKDRITLFFQGKLYDWYGRKVKLESDITRVISAHGSCCGCYGAGDLSRETFVVQRSDNSLATATLLYENIPAPIGNCQNLARSDAIEIAYQQPILSIRTKWSFEYGYELSKSICYALCEIAKNLGNFTSIFANISYQDWGNSNDYVAFSPNCITGKNCCWITNFIMKDRLSLLTTSIEDICKNAIKSDYIRGKLLFSRDGKKIKANSPMPDQNGNTRISADLETISYTKRMYAICWYYDPEP